MLGLVPGLNVEPREREIRIVVRESRVTGLEEGAAPELGAKQLSCETTRHPLTGRAFVSDRIDVFLHGVG